MGRWKNFDIEVTRKQVRQLSCPKCGAEAEAPCLSKRGKPRKSNHIERLTQNDAMMARRKALRNLLSSYPDTNIGGYVVYAIIDPSTKGVIYVGQTNFFDRRRYYHLKSAFKEWKFPPIVQRLQELVADGHYPSFEILEHCDDETASLVAEAKWVERLSYEGHVLLNRWRSHRLLIQQAKMSARQAEG